MTFIRPTPRDGNPVHIPAVVAGEEVHTYRGLVSTVDVVEVTGARVLATHPVVRLAVSRVVDAGPQLVGYACSEGFYEEENE